MSDNIPTGMQRGLLYLTYSPAEQLFTQAFLESLRHAKAVAGRQPLRRSSKGNPRYGTTVAETSVTTPDAQSPSSIGRTLFTSSTDAFESAMRDAVDLSIRAQHFQQVLLRKDAALERFAGELSVLKEKAKGLRAGLPLDI